MAKYICPIHSDVTSNETGTCRKCHVALVEVSRDAHQNHHHEGHDKHEDHNPDMFKQKFLVSLGLTVPTLLFSTTIQNWLGFELSYYGSSYIPAIFGILIFIYGGTVFLKSAKTEIVSRQPGMMTLISMAISVALIYSLLVTFNIVTGMDLWWELATLVTIMLFGHWLEMAAIENTQDALGELAKLLPDKAEVIKNGENHFVKVSEVKVGNIVLIRPGGKIPVDAVVIKGKSDVNESMLTGESNLVSKSIGDKIIGGSINGSGALTARVMNVGDSTALAGIMRLVREAIASKSKTQLLADKAAFYLTYIAIFAALLTWVGWWLAGESAGFILERVVTVLVIACPHALGLAIPLVTSISATLAAKNGLLIRKAVALESARSIDVVLFDKTGTLTKGEQGVVDLISEDKPRTLALALALEAESEHHIAKAITIYTKNKKLPKLKISNFDSLPGIGIVAKLNNKLVGIGGPKMLSKYNIKLGAAIKAAADKASDDGKTVVFVLEDKNVIGALVLADVIREESKETIQELSKIGIRTAILTGDNRGVANNVANELGIEEIFADILPEDKADIVKKLQSDGSRVAMVGDGVNDAPALIQADIGVAIGAGTDVAIESADIILASNDPRGVLKIINLSKKTYSKMIQNLIWATGYNALAIPLAAGATASSGFVLSPAFGAVLMSLSTIIVATNAQLLRKVKP